MLHVDEHPSPLKVFKSSHVSSPPIAPSPQVISHAVPAAFATDPNSHDMQAADPALAATVSSRHDVHALAPTPE